MVAPQEAEDSAPRVWMDITTSLHNTGHHANGTLRVEREMAAALRDEFGERLAFCQYRPNERRFVAASFDPRAEVKERPHGKPASYGAVRHESIGRRLERAVRLSMRKVLRDARARFTMPDVVALFPGAKAGDVLLLGGETWNERYDFDMLTRLRDGRGVKIAAICQDLIPLNHPQFFAPGAFVARHRAYIGWLVTGTDCVIVHSRAVQDDVAAQIAQRGGRGPGIVVVPLGANIEKAAPREPFVAPPLIEGEFVIAVSTIQTRKNFDLLYRLWRRYADEGRRVPRLVLVGARGYGSGELLDAIAADTKLRGSIAVLHNATDAELSWLYRNCRFTLYPSFAEGWGLPISESLAYGKPCLASDTTSMPEAGAGLAVHLDPNDDEAWYAAILRWSDDDAALEAMAQAIAAHYSPTTWAQSAAALADHLRALSR